MVLGLGVRDETRLGLGLDIYHNIYNVLNYILRNFKFGWLITFIIYLWQPLKYVNKFCSICRVGARTTQAPITSRFVELWLLRSKHRNIYIYTEKSVFDDRHRYKRVNWDALDRDLAILLAVTTNIRTLYLYRRAHI